MLISKNINPQQRNHLLHKMNSNEKKDTHEDTSSNREFTSHINNGAAGISARLHFLSTKLSLKWQNIAAIIESLKHRTSNYTKGINENSLNGLFRDLNYAFADLDRHRNEFGEKLHLLDWKLGTAESGDKGKNSAVKPEKKEKQEPEMKQKTGA